MKTRTPFLLAFALGIIRTLASHAEPVTPAIVIEPEKGKIIHPFTIRTEAEIQWVEATETGNGTVSIPVTIPTLKSYYVWVKTAPSSYSNKETVEIEISGTTGKITRDGQPGWKWQPLLNKDGNPTQVSLEGNQTIMIRQPNDEGGAPKIEKVLLTTSKHTPNDEAQP